MRSNSFRDYFARFDIWSLNIDRADAELLVPEEFLKGIGPIVFDQVRIAFDLADEICLITSRIKISVPNLPIIVRAYRVVTLADMDCNMNILGQVFNCYINCERACKLELKGIVSKRADAAYAPGDRGLWLKVKCLHREEFVIVGWTDPEGRRPYLGALLLAYYDPDGRLVYAGRAGTGIRQAELERLWRRLEPLATAEMPLAVPPPRASRFGSPLVLSRVHWVRPELVAEVKYLRWTDDNLLRQVVYEGLREDKPAG